MLTAGGKKKLRKKAKEIVKKMKVRSTIFHCKEQRLIHLIFQEEVGSGDSGSVVEEEQIGATAGNSIKKHAVVEKSPKVRSL